MSSPRTPKETAPSFVLAMARMKPRGVLREPLPAAHEGGSPRSLHIVTVRHPAASAAHVPPVQCLFMLLPPSHGAAIGTVCHSGRRPLLSTLYVDGGHEPSRADRSACTHAQTPHGHGRVEAWASARGSLADSGSVTSLSLSVCLTVYIRVSVCLCLCV